MSSFLTLVVRKLLLMGSGLLSHLKHGLLLLLQERVAVLFVNLLLLEGVLLHKLATGKLRVLDGVRSAMSGLPATVLGLLGVRRNSVGRLGCSHKCLSHFVFELEIV